MLRYFLMIVSVGVLCVSPINAQDIHVVTEEYAPYEYAKDGEVAGMSTEVVRATLKRAGLEASFRIYPWIRAYTMALEEKNLLIYTIERTKEREDLFHWIGPMYPIQFSLFKLKNRKDIKIHTLDDAKSYKIGVVRGFANHQFLLSHGFKDQKQLEPVKDDRQNLQKVFAGRIDLITGEEYFLAVQMSALELPVDELAEVFHLRESECYMAFSKQTSNDLVRRVRTAFEQIKDEGAIEAIVAKYRKQLGMAD